MKLEFFADGFEGKPLILLYDGAPAEVVQLRDLLRRLAGGLGRRLTVNELPFVETVGACRLRARCAFERSGIRATAATDFEWTLDPESWREVEELLEPFCQAHDHVAFQHLDSTSDAEVVYSTDRAW